MLDYKSIYLLAGLILRVIGDTFVDITEVNCFLCGSTRVKRTRERRPVDFHIIRYFYKCLDCKGYSLWPKLENWEIQKLYSTNYIGDVGPESSLEYESDKARFAQLENFLREVNNPNQMCFLDYGCGASADTVIMAKALGFQSFGVEVVQETRTEAKKVSGCTIYSPEELASGQYRFDIVFMGDVLEHVSDPISLLKSVQENLNSDGTLIIQGPMEGALTLSNFLVAIKALLLFKRPGTFPPYHVSLATRISMIKMLATRGLRANQIEITEPYWPAPRLGSKDSLTSLSRFLLSIAKQLDIGIHKIRKSYGTRFFLKAKNL